MGFDKSVQFFYYTLNNDDATEVQCCYAHDLSNENGPWKRWTGWALNFP